MYEDARRERAQRREWLTQEETDIKELSVQIASEAAKELGSNVRWAERALEAAKLGPYAQSLFGERRDHFRDEKNLLSRSFAPLLLSRAQWHAKRGKHVFVVVDSGTTLFPFFEQFGIEAVYAKIHATGQGNWIKDQITFVTNNLPGVESFIEFGRLDQRDRYAPLELDCHLLPGTPLPVYSALTGRATIAALQQIKEEAESAVFLGLVTGNWVRIRRTMPQCPLPLARGPGHLDFKQKLIDICDETYVVAPLGKVFVNTSKDELNIALGFGLDQHTGDGGRPYDEVSVTNEQKAKSIRLVSTIREGHRLLYAHSRVVSSALNSPETQVSSLSTSSGPGHLLFPFDTLPSLPQLELKTEFPHPNTRTLQILGRFGVERPTATRANTLQEGKAGD